MLSKKFQLVKTEINHGNYRYAKKILSEIDLNLASDISKEYHKALSALLPENFHYSSQSIFDERNEAMLSDLDSQEIKPGISIVSCCMNRNHNLKKSLVSWLKLPVDEIIIVDWSSDIPISETIRDIDDPRVKILRVNGESKWVLTYAFNVGLRFASYSKIYKFDADIETSEDFLELNSINLNQFVRGYWKSALEKGLNEQVYVNGSFGAYKKHLKEVGYYNELIRTYGWDDSDLYERLSSFGLETKYLNFDSVLHLEQEESERTINQNVISESFLGLVKPTEFNNQRNRFIGKTTEYWNIHRLQDYKLHYVDEKSFDFFRVSHEIEIPNYILHDANLYAAMHFMSGHDLSAFNKAKDVKSLAEFIFKEYESRIDFEITNDLLGEFEFGSEVLFFDNKFKTYEEFISYALEYTKENNVSIFAISICQEYSHKRIGEYGAFVEIVNIPDFILESILQLRQKNNLLHNHISTVRKVHPKIVNDVFFSHFCPKVYVDAQHGLGNRIRAIGSAAAIAKETNRELVIVWEADHHCECDFEDLFDYEMSVVKKSFIHNASKYMDVYNYMEIESDSCKDEYISINNGRHLYLRAAYTFKSPLSTWDTENEFIKKLCPTNEIMKLVNQFNVNNCLAAHIRMEAGEGLDNNSYDLVDNWTQEGHDQLYYWREKSHYSAFLKRIDELIDKTPNIKLFVATDLQETYDIFEKYYGDRLIYLKREVFDRSKLQIKYALADAILLSKCEKLLGSTWSSFSELAMRLSNTYSEIEMSGKDF